MSSVLAIYGTHVSSGPSLTLIMFHQFWSRLINWRIICDALFAAEL